MVEVFTGAPSYNLLDFEYLRYYFTNFISLGTQIISSRVNYILLLK